MIREQIKMKKIKIVDVVLKYIKTIVFEKNAVLDTKDAVDIVQNYLGERDREHLSIICLNARCEPTHLQIVAIGDLCHSTVHPRELMKVAILSNAASIIITHNHPSGYVIPSVEDIEMTHLMKQVCHIMQINLWDHIIYSGENYYSILQESPIFNHDLLPTDEDE